MVQDVIVLMIFAAAVFYLGRMVYRAFTESGCVSGCGKCAIADMQKQMKKKR